jgi:hypothetical protein
MKKRNDTSQDVRNASQNPWKQGYSTNS